MTTPLPAAPGHLHDVVVVGAGPAGSVCARHLARRGHDVLVLERDPAPGASANCTGIIGAEAFDVFDLPRDLVVNSISGVRFRGPYGREVSFAAGRVLAHVVRRRDFDAALARDAAAAGAGLCCGVEVLGGLRRDGGVDVQVGVDGRRLAVRARALVLAVGYQLGLLRAFGFEGPADFVQGVQLLCPNHGVEEVEVYVGRRWAPGSFGWAVPLEPGRVKIGLTTARRARQHLDALLRSEHLRRRVSPEGGRLRLSPIPVGALSRCHDDRVLVVGEAAGQVKTTSNGGIYYSMLGARAAAEVLDGALRRDDLSAAALRGYEMAWRKTLEPELEAGRQLREVFESMSDARLATLMWFASAEGLLEMIRERADFDWHRALIEDLSSHRLIGAILGGSPAGVGVGAGAGGTAGGTAAARS